MIYQLSIWLTKFNNNGDDELILVKCFLCARHWAKCFQMWLPLMFPVTLTREVLLFFWFSKPGNKVGKRKQSICLRHESGQLDDLEFEFLSPHCVPSSIWHWTVASVAIEGPIPCSAGPAGVPLACRGTAFLLFTNLSSDFSLSCTWLTLIPNQAHVAKRDIKTVLEFPLPPLPEPLSLVSYFIPWAVNEPWTTCTGIPIFSVFYNPRSPSHFVVVSIVPLPKRPWSSFGGNLLLVLSRKMNTVTICISNPSTYIFITLPHLEHHNPTFFFHETVT